MGFEVHVGARWGTVLGAQERRAEAWLGLQLQRAPESKVSLDWRGHRGGFRGCLVTYKKTCVQSNSKNIYHVVKICDFATDPLISTSGLIVDLLLVTLQLWRPADTKDLNIVLTVCQDFLALFSTWAENYVVKAFWEKGLAQEVVDVRRAAQFDQWHEWLRRDRKGALR